MSPHLGTAANAELTNATNNTQAGLNNHQNIKRCSVTYK